MEPIYKFNNGRGAQLCNECRVIIHAGERSNRVLCDSCLEKVVNTWKVENKEGFTQRELNRLIAHIGKDNISMKRFNDALTGITGLMFDDEFITYHCDILTALRVAMEDRPMRHNEWD
jgi:hypothetical protein